MQYKYRQRNIKESKKGRKIVMWQDVLEEVANTMKKFRRNRNSGLVAEDMPDFFAAVEQELGCSVPEEYLKVLKVVNGLEFNGSILYGADEEFVSSEPNQAINGLIDNNKVLYENEWQKQYLFLGENSISWYVYDLQTKRYLELDNPSGEVEQEFTSCEELVEGLLRVALM